MQVLGGGKGCVKEVNLVKGGIREVRKENRLSRQIL